MLAAMLVLALVVGAPAEAGSALRGVAAVPDEPGASFLPDDEPTFQAVAADLDGDGARDLVRLVGGERGSIRAEAWSLR